MVRRQRAGRVRRNTKETRIDLALRLDPGVSRVRTDIPFLGHMLVLAAAHGGFRLEVTAKGDVDVDDHHLAEDMGICLGKALAVAIGDKRGIRRYGEALVPMDEALVQAALDLSGRAHLSYGLKPNARRIKSFDVGLVEEFMLGFVRNVPCTLHIRQLAGRNAHHVVEAAFKALGRALGQAAETGGMARSIPSTKGLL